MIGGYKPLPVLLGDTFGSTLAVMLYPDSMPKARNWHAKHLASGALTAYRHAGHTFDGERFDAFLEALAEVDVSSRETSKRIRGAALAADAMKVLWALVCSNPEKASWQCAIEEVNKANSREIGGSPSNIRQQLRRFAPVLHLWLAWRLSDDPVPQEGNLFLDAYAILFELRAWADSRPESYRRQDAYLSVREFGPWPEMAQFMEALGGSWQKRISLVSTSA